MKKQTKYVGLIIVVILFATMALGSGSSNDSDARKVGEVSTSISDSSETSTSESSVSSEDQNSAVKKDAKEDKTAKPEEFKEEYHVGDILDYKGLKIVYMDSCNFVSDNTFMKPQDGNKYVRLHFYFENSTGSDVSVTVYDFKCYADGYECSEAYFNTDISATLSDGRKNEGCVTFEVPETAEKVEVEYELNWLSEKKALFVFDGDKDSGFVPEKNTDASVGTFKVGDIVETKELKITYLKSDEYVSDNKFVKPEEGMKYVYIELEYENISDSDQSVTYFSFDGYADGVSCKSFYGMDNALSATLSPGRKAKGTVAFEVPKDTQTIEIEYKDNFWKDSRIIFAVE